MSAKSDRIFTLPRCFYDKMGGCYRNGKDHWEKYLHLNPKIFFDEIKIPCPYEKCQIINPLHFKQFTHTL